MRTKTVEPVLAQASEGILLREERHEVARRYEQDPEFRQRVAQHHRDSDGAFWSWAQVWLNPAYRSWSMVDRLERVRSPYHGSGCWRMELACDTGALWA